jgi:hypothetical protein
MFRFSSPVLRCSLLWLASATIALPVLAAPQKAAKTAKLQKTKTQKTQWDGSPKPHIDIVFAIDCSGSMGGVIETAKQKVWSIVNEVAKAKPSPVLRIGLFGYGDADKQFRKFELSDDLDEVYQNLMTFKDEGWGTEYVGLLVQKATDEMKWAEGSKTLKVIYMVGNETAKQGQTDYTTTAPAAAKREIFVNAIYCGSSGGEETWREMAQLGKGQFMQIAASGGGLTLATPFDTQLAALNARLNKTYIPYGSRGVTALLRQRTQDSNSAAVGGAMNMASRAQAKATTQYNNRGWDLVDASREKDFDLKKVRKEELPANMQKMTLAQQQNFIAKNAAERARLHKQIRLLGTKRDAYLKTEIKKRGLNQSQALDDAIRRSVVGQAQMRGFKF